MSPITRLAKSTLKRLLPVETASWLRARKWRLRINEGQRLVPEKELTSKYREALTWLLEKESAESLGDYLEFGVFNGTSLACMHDVLKQAGTPASRVRLFGFDSFEGLPESAESDGWIPGTYHIDYGFTHKWLSRRGVDWKRTFLIKGWFSDTLTSGLIRQHDIQRAGIVMFDCDAYQSTKEALDFIGPLLGEHAVFLFDDWNAKDRALRDLGQKPALDEFLAKNPQLKVSEFGSYNENSHVVTVERTSS